MAMTFAPRAASTAPVAGAAITRTISMTLIPARGRGLFVLGKEIGGNSEVPRARLYLIT